MDIVFVSVYSTGVSTLPVTYIRFCNVPCTFSTWGAWDVVYDVVCFIPCSSQNCPMLRLKNSLPLSVQLRNHKIVFFPKDQFPHLHILKVFKFSRAKFQFRFFVLIFTTPSKMREVWIVLKCVNEEKKYCLIIFYLYAKFQTFLFLQIYFSFATKLLALFFDEADAPKSFGCMERYFLRILAHKIIILFI